MRLVPTEEIRLSDIMYDYDKSSLRPESVMALDSLINFLNKSPNVSIAIHSHTDSRGSDSYNLALSQRRAQSVVDYLISKGISSQRLIAQGHGESRLINRCKDKAECDEAEHQLNRRTAFSITAIDLDRVIVKYKRVTGEETEDAEEAVYKAISDKRKSRRPARQASR
jgi:outer membrane protein OmpA-like peptidoglycan-associated protein